MPDCEQKHCPYCGHPLPPGTSFCLHCCKRLVQTRRPLNRKPFPGAPPLSAGALLLAGCVLTVRLFGSRRPASRRGRLTATILRQPGSVRKQRVRQLDPAGGAAIPAVVFGLRSVCFAQSPSFRIWLRARFLVIDGSSATINRTGYYGEVVTNAYRLEQAIKSLIRQEDSGLYVPSAMYRPDIMATDPLYTKFMASYETDLRVLKVNTSRAGGFYRLVWESLVYL